MNNIEFLRPRIVNMRVTLFLFKNLNDDLFFDFTKQKFFIDTPMRSIIIFLLNLNDEINLGDCEFRRFLSSPS